MARCRTCTETAVTLHPLFGVPYIPASSLKGVVRIALQAFFAGNESAAETSETWKLDTLKQFLVPKNPKAQYNFMISFYGL